MSRKAAQIFNLPHRRFLTGQVLERSGLAKREQDSPVIHAGKSACALGHGRRTPHIPANVDFDKT
jgi:hypothetical protein